MVVVEAVAVWGRLGGGSGVVRVSRFVCGRREGCVAAWLVGLGCGWGLFGVVWGWAGLVDGPVVVGVCESEVDESFEVDCGGAGGEPLPVAFGAAAGASSVVADEPRDGALGHGPPSVVSAAE